MATQRYSLRAVAPDAYAAMTALDRVAHSSSLPRPLLELVKMRASQLNGCAYCLDMHGADALALGIPPQKLFVLNAWREAPFYTRTLRTSTRQTLVQDGPYRLVRHPGYLGVLVLWLGAGLASANALVAAFIAIVMGCAYRRRIGSEEALLGATFGEEYVA